LQKKYLIHKYLSISAIVSFIVLIYLFRFNENGFWKRPIAEQLVVYIDLSDFYISSIHESDHIYMVIAKAHPPDTICSVYGMLVSQQMMCQSIIILFTAFNAFMLVERLKKIELGSKDSLWLPFCFLC